MTHLNLSSIVGSAPTYQAGVLSYYPPVKASVAPSGEAIILQFQDGIGNPINVSSIASINDIQTISVSGPPLGQRLHPDLRRPDHGDDRGHAHAAGRLCPLDSGRGLDRGPAPGRRDDRPVFWRRLPDYFVHEQQLYYEVFDGSTSGTLLYSAAGPVPVAPDDFNDGTYSGDGNPISWHVIGGPGHTFTSATGTLMVVRVSAATTDPGNWFLDAMQVKNLTANTTIYYDDQEPGVLGLRRPLWPEYVHGHVSARAPLMTAP